MTIAVDSTLWRVGNDIGTDFEYTLREYIDSLESKIAQLESTNSCDGCKWSDPKLKSREVPCDNCCDSCLDKFEPKQ